MPVKIALNTIMLKVNAIVSGFRGKPQPTNASIASEMLTNVAIVTDAIKSKNVTVFM